MTNSDAGLASAVAPARHTDFDEGQFNALSQKIHLELDRLLPTALNVPGDLPQTALHDAMRYTVLSGGKRIRPMLTILTAEALSAQQPPKRNLIDAATLAGCAIECLHAYSLIHDDLPAMDDDDLRRGQPTCHIRYGEACAILAGDALQTLAFDILSSRRLTAFGVGADAQLRMVRQLAFASGATGMVGGQALDLSAEGKSLDRTSLETLHAMKTGALIETSVLMGLYVHQNVTEELEADLRRFGQIVGLGFQIQDDILDVVSDTASLGKTAGKDERQHKSTFVRLLGLDGARNSLSELMAEAADILQRRQLQHSRLEAFTSRLATRIS